MTSTPTAKIALTSPDGEVETLWAYDLGNGRYQLDNLPWYAYGLSVGDIVVGRPDTEGQIHFQSVVTKSGNRTIRVILQKAPNGNDLSESSEQVLPGLERLGCSWEGANKRLIAINIPATASLEAVTDFLMGTDAEWEYADPTPEEMGIQPDA